MVNEKEYEAMLKGPKDSDFDPDWIKSVEKLPHPNRMLKLMAKVGKDISLLGRLKQKPGSFLQHRRALEGFSGGLAAVDMLYALRLEPRVFNIAEDLGNLLRKTDVKGAEYDMLRVPFPCIFLQFPPNDFIVYSGQGNDSAPLEGVYVIEENQFDVADVVKDLEKTGIPKALIDKVVEEKNIKDTKLLLMISVGRQGAVNDCLASMPVYFRSGASIEEQFQIRLDDLLSRKTGPLLENIKQADQIFKWVTNCLLYINSSDSDVRKEWLHKGLADKVKKAKGPKKAKLRQALERDSVEIHHVGRTIKIGSLPSVSPGESSDDKRKMALHWVRGFWRNQACGPQYSEHKHKWIRPFLRGEGSEIVGKMYKAQ